MQRIWIYPASIRTTVVLCVSSVHHPFSCLYAHGGDQGWRQQSVLSYVLQLLFVEKAGGVHTMVKVMLNVPFRNHSSMWTDIAPEQKKNNMHETKMLCKKRKIKALYMLWRLINHFRPLDQILSEVQVCHRNYTDKNVVVLILLSKSAPLILLLSVPISDTRICIWNCLVKM